MPRSICHKLCEKMQHHHSVCSTDIQLISNLQTGVFTLFSMFVCSMVVSSELRDQCLTESPNSDDYHSKTQYFQLLMYQKLKKGDENEMWELNDMTRI